MTALMPDARAILARHHSSLEDALQGALPDDGTALTAAARYVMGWTDEHGKPASNGGKRIRPALCLFAAEALGGTIEDALPGAVAIELVHNFSLVHDEVQDHDAERHHRPTTWARLGEAQAINVGDFLYTRALRALTHSHGDVHRRMRALAVLNDAVTRMIEGQWLDIAYETEERVTVEQYLHMVAGKTGALLSAPLQMGAILAGASDTQTAAVGEWGQRIGAAFQAQDDYLGIWGDPGQTGKSNTGDIARRKKALPVVHASADPDFGAVIARTYAQPEITDAAIAAVVGALKSAGSDAYCRERARSEAREANLLLDPLPFAPEVRDQFRAIGTYLVDRDS